MHEHDKPPPFIRFYARVKVKVTKIGLYGDPLGSATLIATRDGLTQIEAAEKAVEAALAELKGRP